MNNIDNDPRKSATADKAKGHANETVGKIKSKIGGAIDDRELEAKGDAQNAEGKAQRLKGEIKEKIEDVKDYAKAGVEAVKDKVRDARH